VLGMEDGFCCCFESFDVGDAVESRSALPVIFRLPES